MSFRDEFDRVMNGNAIMTPYHGFTGGEWDVLKTLPRRRRRSLAARGFLRPDGVRPDVAADIIREHVPGMTGAHHDEAIGWYLDIADRINGEQRTERYRRHFRNRNDRATLLGFGSYHYHRLYRSELGPEALL